MTTGPPSPAEILLTAVTEISLLLGKAAIMMIKSAVAEVEGESPLPPPHLTPLPNMPAGGSVWHGGSGHEHGDEIVIR
ncbi:hypothetical protein KSP40_PGU015732 [Platanthera guangdongensis]|uniref:Uncharacterized protein n=1 Tax=Platanthera guangdongensis TaxID=2320717 RepID=A0ABR2M933_9ASPA